MSPTWPTASGATRVGSTRWRRSTRQPSAGDPDRVIRDLDDGDPGPRPARDQVHPRVRLSRRVAAPGTTARSGRSGRLATSLGVPIFFTLGAVAGPRRRARRVPRRARGPPALDGALPGRDGVPDPRLPVPGVPRWRPARPARRDLGAVRRTRGSTSRSASRSASATCSTIRIARSGRRSRRCSATSGSRNLLWGTDMPFQNRFCTYRQSRRWIETCGLLTDGGARRRHGRTTARLLGIEPAGAGGMTAHARARLVDGPRAGARPVGRRPARRRPSSTAIGRGADLRIYTEFLYEEHILPGGGDDRSGRPDPRGHRLPRDDPRRRTRTWPRSRPCASRWSRRTASTAPTRRCRSSCTRWTASRRWPTSCSATRRRPSCRPGERTVEPTPADMPKMGDQEFFDVGTTGPSRNFVYDMETYRFIVRDEWQEVLAHDADGRVTAGSFAALEEAQIAGREIKVGIRDLGRRPRDGGDRRVAHEVVHARRVRLPPRPGRAVRHAHPSPRPDRAGAIPLRYRSGNWDVAWVFLRTDGQAHVRRIDPYTRAVGRTARRGSPAAGSHGDGARFGPTATRSANRRSALKASCNLRPMLISHCPWSREGL